MCCSFNIRAADEIFKGKAFSGLVMKQQNLDKNLTFMDTTLPKKYRDNKEPKTLPGRNKGLVLMLDAHSDLFNQGSVSSDFQGFYGLVKYT